MQDVKTRNLRLMIFWRFLENVAGTLIVLYVPALVPCTPAASNVRYLSDYCIACCRGPIMYFEFVVCICIAGSVYAGSWIAGWLFDNFYIDQGP